MAKTEPLHAQGAPSKNGPELWPDWRRNKPFSELHPDFLRALEGCKGFPAPEQYDELARAVPQPCGVTLPRFVQESRPALARVGGYEAHVAQLREVPTRPNSWHDFFNMCVWAHFPQLRWALNSLHVDPTVGPKDPRNGRAPAQNVAATFDEAGLLVVSSSRDMLEELQALRFKRAFWERRPELLSTTRFWVVGHGLLESLLTPHPGLAARSLLLHEPSLACASSGSEPARWELDRLVAQQVQSWRVARIVLDPIPVLAIPEYADNDRASFYEDMRNIRFEPISRRPQST